MKKGLIILLALVVVLGLWVYSGYNKLIGLNESADSQWAQVETQYQRRLDLIPNLVNSVKGAMKQEEKIFGAIAAARTAYGSATTPNEKAAAASQVESSFGRLLAIMENYPQLASIQTVRDLMAQLEGTENRVSVERKRYNDTILAYNTTIKRFPTNILASITGFGSRTYFQAAEGADVAPTVNLQ